MNVSRFIKSFGALLFCVLPLLHVAQAIEPWADDQLPVRDGLELWFDCSRQNAGRGVVQLPPLSPRDAVDHLIDGSGHGRHLQQPLQDARPEFLQVNGAFVSFDGTNDSLFGLKMDAVMTNTTLFLVAQPRSNPGGLRAFFSLNQAGQNDFTSGINMDLGSAPTPRLSSVSVEGGGMRGITQLLPTWQTPFKLWHIFSLESKVGPSGTRLFIDGAVQGGRDREESLITLNEFVLGGRHYSLRGTPPYIQCFFDGNIAEFLLFSRRLTDSERVAVEQYLSRKYAGLLHSQLEAKPLVPVAQPPAVQVFVPGFTVRPVPLALKNINNLKYRADGKLVALGYNGRIYLLTDQDGDGLEDQAELFWDSNSLRAPIGMALTPPGYARGQGVFVAAKGKLSLIVDTNADDHADAEIIVASGWKELSHGVDALGVALDPHGNIFFGLGTSDFTNPYLVDKATGRSGYQVGSERGTILKVSPDFQHREIVCTGIRFSVALAFNRLGDLFCTDQEGATWLANGNPLDELLWIQPGRHYGFPPRHPKHLADVIDEPSLFDYAPQHQSTCGLNFNESVNGGPAFGPGWWTGDAIVSGYSRGKIFRTRLCKTSAGYVAQNQQLASLNALTVDACVSPKGDLVVAAHTGPPDWGSGPEGEGRLYKISYTDKDAPQPVLAWSSSPSEIRIAFDRPLNPGKLRNLAKRIEITQGKYVFAGDRFEVIRPGYAAVDAQLAQPRFDIPVEAASITPDGRTMIINTPPRYTAVNYGITLSQLHQPGTVNGSVAQTPDVDLVTDLSGIEARWTAAEALSSSDETGAAIWLPHVDLSVSRQLTGPCATHEKFWADLSRPGRLNLRGQLDLWEMLVPAIQPGAKLDYERPRENVTIIFSAARPFRAQLGTETKESAAGAEGRQETLFKHVGEENLVPFEVNVPTGPSDCDVSTAWFTDRDPRRRPFQLRRFLMPWVGGKVELSSDNERRDLPELAGGNWLRGRHIFFNEPVNCQRCHSIRGQGHHVGPDLSNLIFRDYASVLRDIQEPSATLNPDFLAFNIQLKEGEDLTAVLQTETPDQMTLIDGTAHTISLAKARIASIKPSAISFMPEKLLQGLAPGQVKDLMTFLLTLPLEPAPIRIAGEPPARTMAQVESLLKATASVPQGKAAQPINILLCAGPKDHGESEHDYPLWQKRWMTLLSQAERVHADTAWEWPTAKQFETADAIIFYSDNPGWTAARARELETFLGRGKGVIFVHLALDGHEDPQSLARITGLSWQSGVSKYRHGALRLAFSKNPIGCGLESLDMVDESYWNLIGDPKDINLVASAVEEGQSRPQIWAREHSGGRVFVSIPGHYVWSFDDPIYRAFLFRGICWAAGQPPDALADLIPIGARLAE